MEPREILEERKELRRTVLTAIRGFYVINGITLIAAISTIVFPICAWGLTVCCLLIFLYFWKIEKEIKKKEKEEWDEVKEDDKNSN